MSYVRVRNVDTGTDLGVRIRVADRWWARLRGLIGRAEPGPGEGLLLRPCQGVHMHWMRYPLDVIFLDPRGVVVATYPELRPWRFSGTHKEAECALEVRAGTLRDTGTDVGHRIELAEAPGATA